MRDRKRKRGTFQDLWGMCNRIKQVKTITWRRLPVGSAQRLEGTLPKNRMMNSNFKVAGYLQCWGWGQITFRST